MEFLVRIEIELPPGMSDKDHAELFGRERARRRPPSERSAAVDLAHPRSACERRYLAALDAPELEDLLGSLPLRRWMRIDVTALAAPLKRGRRAVVEPWFSFGRQHLDRATPVTTVRS
jgi:muconolactone delta-isomerase